MNLKRIFGAILTLCGIAALLYAAVLFSGAYGDVNHEFRSLMVYGVLGALLFTFGISLIRATNNEP